VQDCSEAAFAELVARHVDLVYSVALRMVCDSHLAKDVTQGVFVALAKSAPELTECAVLAGWLHRTARNVAAQLVRTDVRRRIREQEAAFMNELISAGPNSSWDIVAPQLDALLDDLNEPDRNALLLRYFEKKSAVEMSEILGISQEAAQKRVARAVERLRELFARQGVTVGAGGLVVLLTANAVQAAPAGLPAMISGAVTAGASAAVSTVAATTTMIVMTTFQKILVGAALTVFGVGVFEARELSKLKEANQILLQQQASLARENKQLQRERDSMKQTVLVTGGAPANGNGTNELELLKLRGEVGQLRQVLKDLPSARVALLKTKLASMPDKKIPELVFLKDKDWANAAWNADLETDDGVRLALSKLRDESTDTFLNLTRNALKKYLAEHNDLLPSTLLPLKPYYDADVSVTDEMLERYAFLQTGQISGDHSQSVVRKAVYADPDYDSNQEMSLSGGGGGSFNRFHDAIYNAMMDYTLANNGQVPADPAQLTPFLKRTIDSDTMRKYFGEISNDIIANPPSAAQISIMPALKAYMNAHNGGYPKSPSDLQPYLTTQQQQEALQQVQGP